MDTTTAPAAALETVTAIAAPLPGARKKRSDAKEDKADSTTIVHTLENKQFIQALKAELGLKNDAESGRLLITVALAFRFDEDGNDRFAAAAAEIESTREAEKAKEAFSKKLQDLHSLAAKMGLDASQVEALKAQFGVA
jgi:hypothetical protein